MTRGSTQLGHAATVILSFFPKTKQNLDIPFAAQLASAPPLAGHEKADSAFR